MSIYVLIHIYTFTLAQLMKCCLACAFERLSVLTKQTPFLRGRHPQHAYVPSTVNFQILSYHNNVKYREPMI